MDPKPTVMNTALREVHTFVPDEDFCCLACGGAEADQRFHFQPVHPTTAARRPVATRPAGAQYPYRPMGAIHRSGRGQRVENPGL